MRASRQAERVYRYYYYHYLYSNYRQWIRGPTRNLADRATPTDPLRPTWSLRVARRVARVAPSRSKLLDRAASSDQSRLKRSPERPRDAIFGDVGSILGSILVVFRGCIARATRLGARRAEPLFLLAGVALSRVRRLRRKSENRRKIAPMMLCECAARRKRDFSALGRDLASILVASARSQALQGDLSGVLGRPW